MQINKERKFMINDSVKKYECLLYNSYFENNYQLIALELHKPKVLDANPMAIQMRFENKLTKLLAILEKQQWTILELYKGTAKV